MSWVPGSVGHVMSKGHDRTGHDSNDVLVLSCLGKFYPDQTAFRQHENIVEKYVFYIQADWRFGLKLGGTYGLGLNFNVRL